MPAQLSTLGSFLTPPSKLLVGAPGTGNWTILVWFRCAFVLSRRTIWYLNDGHCLRINTATSSLEFVYGTGADAISSLSGATWYCAAVTKQGTTAARYYLNGVYQSQRTTGLSNNDAAAASIGAWNGSSDWLYASFSTLKVWDAVLTDAEIANESKVRRPLRATDLRAWYPFVQSDTAGLLKDWGGGNRDLTLTGTLVNPPDREDPPIGYGAQPLSVLPVTTTTSKVFADAGARTRSGQTVTITGGRALDDAGLLIELAYDAAEDGRYSGCIPAARIRAVKGSNGFRGLRAYLSDAGRAELELRNEDGAYTAGGGLWPGMWCKVRLAGSGEVLFTGRVDSLRPGYGVTNPYVSVALETTRNDLSIPARSVLLQDTTVEAAALALVEDVDLTNGGGFFLFDHSLFDGPDVLAPTGAANVRVYGDQWMSLATAGGYGKSDGELDVLKALAELMKAEDGRAVWGIDNMLELYSRQYLDDVRDGDATYTLTDTELVGVELGIGSEYLNDLTLEWTPTRWQAGAAIYTYEPDSPASIQPGDYRNFNVSFRLSGNDRILAADNIAVSITQTGPTLEYAWDGGLKATGGTLRVHNPTNSGAASVTKIEVTGTALIQSEKALVRKQDHYGRTVYGTRPLTITTLIDRETQAVSRAQREFATWNERATYAEVIELKPRTRAAAVQWLTLPFATPINVQSDRLAHNARYLSIGQEWRVQEGGVAPQVTLYVEPNVANGLFTFDADGKGFDAGKLA